MFLLFLLLVCQFSDTHWNIKNMCTEEWTMRDREKERACTMQTHLVQFQYVSVLFEMVVVVVAVVDVGVTLWKRQ